MNQLHQNRHRPIAAVLAGLVSTFVIAPAHAAKFDVDMDTSGVSAAAIEQPAPEFPDGKMRGGQEGWVRLHFVISPDGRAVDPVIVDSAGGPLFEQAAIDVVSGWQFEAPGAGAESANNRVDIRFEISGDRDRATRGFLRRYRDIVSDLYYVKPQNARDKVDMANDFGGWNLYESTMLALLNARVEAAEGDAVEELEYYRRALAVSGPAALDDKERVEILGRILNLEIDSGLYGEALKTLGELRGRPGSDAVLEELADSIRALERSIEDDAAMVASATIYNPCNCETGTPLWAYTPVHRDFSFAEVSGNVQRFEARCDNHRLSAQVETGARWSLPAEWGSCRVFVFGDDAATFEFVEHRGNPGDGGNAVANSDVLDK
ncbi:MAG TPA: energy transducer TonB [Woeseiaceae bacterium]|nr:energy transducer TonB [Woeseiaceae bacterium]